MKILVRFDHEVVVELPESDDEEKIVGEDGEVLPEAQKRAIDAAVSAFPQEISIFIDGEDADPAEVSFDVSDTQVEEVSAE